MGTLLAADIGGTKTDLAIFTNDQGSLTVLRQQRYRNRDFSGFDQVLDAFLALGEQRPQAACLAVAGVVVGARVQLTNLSWVIDSRAIAERFGLAGISLINDLTAVATAIPHLHDDDLAEIQAGQDFPGEMRAIIAPGTGLGEGMLLAGGEHFFARGSEGGHCNFAPLDEEQISLLAYVANEVQPVSYEALIAGPGLARIYDFYRNHWGMKGDEAVDRALAEAVDPIPWLLAAALRDDPCPLCRKVVMLFLAILGSEAGNLALKLYARGGIYLGGGLLPRLTAGRVSFAGFLEAFLAKGAMSELMATIPVRLILRGDVALLGAGHHGWREFAEVLRADAKP